MPSLRAPCERGYLHGPSELHTLRLFALRLGEIKGNHDRAFGLLDTLASEIEQQLGEEAMSLIPKLSYRETVP